MGHLASMPALACLAKGLDRSPIVFVVLRLVAEPKVANLLKRFQWAEFALESLPKLTSVNELRLMTTNPDKLMQALDNLQLSVCKRITSLFILFDGLRFRDGNYSFGINLLKRVVAMFPLLKVLKASIMKDMPLAVIIGELAKLPHLEQLYLDTRNFSWFDKSLYKLPQMRSIKRLHLTYFRPLCRLNRFAAAIGYLFPKLEELTIDAGSHANAERMFGKACQEEIPNCTVKLIKYVSDFRVDLAYIGGRHYV